MIRPGLASHCRHLLLALCLLLLTQVSHAAAGTVRLAWNANTEADLARYVLVWGTSSGVYTQSLDVAAATPSAEVSGLTDGTYYFAVRAVNDSGAFSGYSNEVVATVTGSPVSTPVTLTAASPASGPATGGTDVVLTGTGFVAGMAATFGGTPATVLAQTGTTLTVRTPSGAAGAVTIVVTAPGGASASLPQAFTYVAVPTISSLSPSSGPAAGGTNVTIVGTNFQSGAVVKFGAVTGTTTSVTATTIVARSPAQAVGVVTVTVTNPSGQVATAAQTFRYLAAAPTVSGMSPLSGPVAGGTNVTISGSGFQNGVIVRFGSLQATVSSVTTTSLVARSPAQAAGPVVVTVQNPDGQSTQASQTFTYQGGPVVTGLSVLSGPTSGGTQVTVTGTGFQPGATVRFGTVSAAISASSATSLVVSTPAQSAGASVVTVVNPDGQVGQAAQTFTYVAVVSPTVTSFSPSSGPTAGGTDVTITGSNFSAGVVVRFGGLAASVVQVTPTRLVVKTPSQSKGTVSLGVQNADGNGVLVPNAFTYRGKPPSVSTIAPLTGSVAGGTEVVLDGSDFEAGLSVSVDAMPATVVSVSPTRLIIRMPAHAPARVGLTITNPDSQITWMPSAFTYVTDGMAITGVLPTTGPPAGGTSVTILGTRFEPGAKVTFDGTAATVVSQTADVLTVLTPAHAPGVVSVMVVNPGGQSASATNAFTYEVDQPTFTRYFAEGASSAFFSTRFALANPHTEPVAVTVTFTDTRGVATPMQLTVPALSRFTLDERNRPVLGSDAFATKFEAARVIGIERTMTWAAGGLAYGSHSETGVAAPRTSWLLAEGATIAGFDTFYLLQNPTDSTAKIKVQYLLSSGERIEKIHDVAPQSRTNIWVNMDDPALKAAEMSATITSLNDVPVVVERSMYRNSGTQLFTTGHNSAAVDAPALRWFLAEGATGGTFDEFVLIANPNATTATLRVSYLRAGAAPIVKTYTARPSSRLTIWVDQEAPELAAAEVSVIVEAVTPTPVVVERSMWWSATPGGEWTEAHNNRGTTTTAARWIVADGEAGGPGDASTYVLVANTAQVDAPVRFTLLTEGGQTRTVEGLVTAQGRYTIDVAGTFPEARNSRFSVLVESVSGTAPLVVERASYSSTATTTWAAGTNALGMPLP